MIFFLGCRDYARRPSETRPKDYLKKEFKQRLSREPLKYKLQLSVHEARSDDSSSILNIARYWEETTHPWFDVAEITLTSFLSPADTDGLRFNVGTLPSSLYFLPARTVHDSNCIAHIRKEVYASTQMIRSIRCARSREKPCHMATYIINVETGGQARVNGNANISICLTGTCFIKEIDYFLPFKIEVPKALNLRILAQIIKIKY